MFSFAQSGTEELSRSGGIVKFGCVVVLDSSKVKIIISSVATLFTRMVVGSNVRMVFPDVTVMSSATDNKSF